MGGLFGLALKLAQSTLARIGICVGWKLPLAVVNRELMDPDSTVAEDGSIRPSCYTPRTHAQLRSGKSVSVLNPSQPVVRDTLTSRPPKYGIILDLDWKVGDMEEPFYPQQVLAAAGVSVVVGTELGVAIPGGAEGRGLVVDMSLGLGETISQSMPVSYRELSASFCFSSPLQPTEFGR